jgi:hypothetical protein
MIDRSGRSRRRDVCPPTANRGSRVSAAAEPSARLSSRGLRRAALLVVTVGWGCTGSVSGPPNGNTGSGGPGDNGQNGGGPNNMGSGGNGGGVGTPSAQKPGRVTMRRLNQREYDNTIRDLVGLDLKPSAMFEFPEDEWGDGFNNNADILNTSPLVIEKYLNASQFAIDKALDPAPANATVRSKIVTCNPAGAAEAECGRKIVNEFARRAFRRVVTPEEVAPFVALIDSAKKLGETFEVGLAAALSGLLVAPEFLFRMEIDGMRGAQRALNDYEIASRLSYFIFASMPDEELLKQAQAGTLKQPAQIGTQVKRMLADPKASAFTEVMVQQWMNTVGLKFTAPNPATFPKWQEPLKAAMEQELKAFMAPILGGQASAKELLTARYTYANRALATYYGLSGANAVASDKFDRVPIMDDKRGGVLRQGAFLVMNSHPDSNSPTHRGKWILEKLLCIVPPPAPADIPAFDPKQVTTGTLRQKLESVHQKLGTACNSCHAIIDPMGFALEHYDAAGLWRDTEDGLKIDASGKMPGTDVPFDGAAQLTEAIANDARFPACVAKHLMTYAMGRNVTDSDRPYLDELGKQFAAGGFNMPSLVEAVAKSPMMTAREAEKE